MQEDVVFDPYLDFNAFSNSSSVTEIFCLLSKRTIVCLSCTHCPLCFIFPFFSSIVYVAQLEYVSRTFS